MRQQYNTIHRFRENKNIYSFLKLLSKSLLLFVLLIWMGCESEDDEGDIAAPEAQITANTTQIEEGQAITYSSASTGTVDRVEWQFTGGDITSSTDATVTVKYDNAGTYSTTLIATNSGGSDDDQLSIMVNKASPTNMVDADFNASATNALAGAEITFTDVSSGNPTIWNWLFEGGTPATSNLENPKVTYAQSGTYSVSLTASAGDDADTETKQAYITIFDPAIADFSSSVTEIIEGESVEFIDESTNADTWLWTFAGGNPSSSTEQNPTVVYNTFGTYSVTLQVNNSNSEDMIIKEGFIEVSPAVDTLSDLVAHYRFDTNAKNEMDEDNPGIALGGAQYIADRNGNGQSAISFNGTTSYVNIFNSIPGPDYTGDITYSFWINAALDSANSSILGLFSSKSLIDVMQVDGDIMYKVFFRNNAAATISVTEIVRAPFAKNTWVHIAIRHKANEFFELFVNNELMGREPINRSQIHESSLNSSIGAKSSNSDYTNHFEGFIDELRIYSRALTNEEIEALFLEE